MACPISSVEGNLEEESEITRCDREYNEIRERSKSIDNTLKQIELFDLNNVQRISEEEEIEELCLDESPAAVTLPGIKFFSHQSNCDYDQNSVKAELSEFNHCSELDIQSLNDFKDKILYEYIIENSTHKEHPFGPFTKLLFTSQSPEYLRVVSEILILYLGKSSQVYSFLEIIVSTLPVGLKNIGGNVSKLFRAEKLPDNSICNEVNKFSPVENIRYVVDVLLHLLRKTKVQLNGELMMPNPLVDDLIFTLLIISQDPQILSSTVIPPIQNCLAELLDIYPSDLKYLEKIQDIVERILLYWGDCFDHVTAYVLCVDVIPLSRRGKQLKASLAYCSLNFCLPSSEELNILDRVRLYELSKFCQEKINEFLLLDCKTLYSVIRLIDAAIMRPINVDQDLDHVKLLLKTITRIYVEKSSLLVKEDYYHMSKLKCLISEFSMPLKKLIPSSSEMGEDLY